MTADRMCLISGTAERLTRRPLTNTCVEVPPWRIVSVRSRVAGSTASTGCTADSITADGRSMAIRSQAGCPSPRFSAVLLTVRVLHTVASRTAAGIIREQCAMEATRPLAIVLREFHRRSAKSMTVMAPASQRACAHPTMRSGAGTVIRSIGQNACWGVQSMAATRRTKSMGYAWFTRGAGEGTVTRSCSAKQAALSATGRRISGWKRSTAKHPTKRACVATRRLHSGLTTTQTVKNCMRLHVVRTVLIPTITSHSAFLAIRNSTGSMPLGGDPH